MDNQNTLEELKEVLKSYKKGKYTYGKYWTGDQIEKAFLEGKIFVLKGTKKIFYLFIIIPILYAIFIPVIQVISGASYYMIILIITSIEIPIIVSLLLLPICISVIRWFVVISPSGVYYRRVTKKGYFQWKNVTLAKGSIHTTRGGYRRPPVTTARVTIILPNNKEVLFDSGRYGNKEFVRKVKRVMFLRIFQIYSELGKDTFRA